MTDAQRRANKKWNDAHRGEKYEQIGLLVFKGEKAEFQAAATAAGEKSLSAYIRQAIREKMSRDAAQDVE